MKKSNFIISIPKPCTENWSEMIPEDKGRFCQSCQKKVIDFTLSSDREIANAFEKNGSICGRFLNSQLNRKLIVPKEKSSIWMATTSAIISFLGFGGEDIVAQEKPLTEQTDSKTDVKKCTVKNKIITVTGTVSDDKGPLPGANVVIKGTRKSVQTDLNGNFSIKAKENDALVLSFIGMEDKTIIVNEKNKHLKINLKLHHAILGMIIIEE